MTDQSHKLIGMVVRASAAQLVAQLIEAAHLRNAHTVPIRDVTSCLMAILSLPLPVDDKKEAPNG